MNAQQTTTRTTPPQFPLTRTVCPRCGALMSPAARICIDCRQEEIDYAQSQRRIAGGW